LYAFIETSNLSFKISEGSKVLFTLAQKTNQTSICGKYSTSEYKFSLEKDKTQ